MNPIGSPLRRLFVEPWGPSLRTDQSVSAMRCEGRICRG
jgi:hypothetical protein